MLQQHPNAAAHTLRATLSSILSLVMNGSSNHMYTLQYFSHAGKWHVDRHVTYASIIKLDACCDLWRTMIASVFPAALIGMMKTKARTPVINPKPTIMFWQLFQCAWQHHVTSGFQKTYWDSSPTPWYHSSCIKSDQWGNLIESGMHLMWSW